MSTFVNWSQFYSSQTKAFLCQSKWKGYFNVGEISNGNSRKFFVVKQLWKIIKSGRQRNSKHYSSHESGMHFIWFEEKYDQHIKTKHVRKIFFNRTLRQAILSRKTWVQQGTLWIRIWSRTHFSCSQYSFSGTRNYNYACIRRSWTLTFAFCESKTVR